MATCKLQLRLFAFLVISIYSQLHGTQAQSFQDISLCLQNSGIQEHQILSRNTTPSAYDEVNSQWNSRGGTIYPLGYLLAETSTDVQKAVLCGRQLNIRVIPKAGGHGFIKYAYGDSNSFVVDLRKMADVSSNIQDNTVTVGAGARQGKMAYLIWEQGNFTTATGICPAVGIAGYALGGGQGLLVREFGIMSDNIIEVEMVDAEGRLLIANNIVNPDLYWALRGGGGGNFGIVTKFKFKVYTAPPQVATYSFTYDFNTKFQEVFAAYQDYVSSNLTAIGGFGLFDGTKTFNLDFWELLYDDRESQMEKIIAMLPPAANFTSNIEPYPMFLMSSALNTYNERIRPNVNITVPADLINIGDGVGQEFYRRKSFFVNKTLNSSEIEALYLLYRNVLPILPQWIEPYGGVANNLRPDETAFVHRGESLYIMNLRYEGILEDNIWNEEAAKFFEESKPIFGHTTSYQNYVDDDMDDFLPRYYGSNLEKLMRVKTAFDPENYFHNPQSIPAAVLEDVGKSTVRATRLDRRMWK